MATDGAHCLARDLLDGILFSALQLQHGARCLARRGGARGQGREARPRRRHRELRGGADLHEAGDPVLLGEAAPPLAARELQESAEDMRGHAPREAQVELQGSDGLPTCYSPGLVCVKEVEGLVDAACALLKLCSNPVHALAKVGAPPDEGPALAAAAPLGRGARGGVAEGLPAVGPGTVAAGSQGLGQDVRQPIHCILNGVGVILQVVSMASGHVKSSLCNL
mmetsp:Transcript_136596/g.332090  ORF Transcript_136596/g.332090 Transcript_136596/m.332090 type:complete len:223 (-) Transcript_136596:63-731(-)